jgi:hypothetical protein
MQRKPFDLMVHMVPDYLKTNIRIPEVQREPKIWTLEQKQNLIDSLYNDFDIPKIYLREKEGEPNIWWLIDGQQRLTTIKEFLNNEFALASDLGDNSTIPQNIQGKKFRQINPDDKARIINRILNCVLVTCDDDEEEDMFTRLNNGTPLSAPEKRNAIRGEVRDSIKKLAKHKFLKHKVNFSPKRYAYDAVCAQLTVLCISRGPTDTKGKALKKLYEENRVYPEKKDVETKIKKILNLMNKVFKNKEPYMKKYNVASIFLLFQELLDNYAVSKITNSQWFEFFNGFERQRIQNSLISEDNPNFDSDINKYQFSCVNSPDSEDGIKTRHDVLLKKFFSKFTNIEPKDPERDFSEHQKIAIYFLKEKKCCGTPGFTCPNRDRILTFEECQFDHVREHNDAGKTIVSNGQILCAPCHAHKTSTYRSQIRRS